MSGERNFTLFFGGTVALARLTRWRRWRPCVTRSAESARAARNIVPEPLDLIFFK